LSVRRERQREQSVVVAGDLARDVVRAGVPQSNAKVVACAGERAAVPRERGRIDSVLAVAEDAQLMPVDLTHRRMVPSSPALTTV
jgi:hypothetical protein